MARLKLDGVLLLDKPVGPSSSAVLQAVKRLLNADIIDIKPLGMDLDEELGIMDADFAVETANLSRAQILQQAGNSMIAQANQLPQQVLKLLQ